MIKHSTNDTQNNTPESLWFGQSKSDGNFAEFSHDKNGNRLSKMVKSNANDVLGQASYTWDARNRMLNYTLNDTIQTTSRYQFSGPRYEKKESDSGKTVTTKYYVDAGHRLLSEKVIGDSGIKEYSYIYLGNQKLARISQNDVSKKDEISYYLTDALGSATMTTYQHTASPNTPILVSQSLLDPWGNSVRNGMFHQTTQQDFTGKVMDERSGLYDFGFRFYDPLTAAWIGKDLVPADHNAPLSLNEYLYCLNNPLMFVDPDGRLPGDQLMFNSTVVSPAGPRIHPITKKLRNHAGLDLVGDGIVHAAAKGVVNVKPDMQLAPNGTGWGNYLELKHVLDDGTIYLTRYAHLKNLPKFKIGDEISEGQGIGEMGATGGVTGPHLHFELLKFNERTKKFDFQYQGEKYGFPNIGNYNKLSEVIK